MLTPKALIISVFILLINQSLISQWSTGTNSIYYNGGNVGIGTSSPATKLHISGGHIAASNDDALSGFVQMWSDNAIIWKYGSTSTGLRFGSATNLSSANWSEKMRITDGGQVGIGTPNPVGTLHVNAGNQTTGDQAALFEKPREATNAAFTYSFENVGGVLANNRDGFWRGFHLAAPYITVNGVKTFPRLGFYAEYDSYTNPTVVKWVINAANSIAAHDIQFKSFDNELMYLKANGNVGIGTTTPNAKLAVNGDIFCKKVKVTLSGWPDYVFHSTYHLRPLSEVEQYIQQNHHLPEVPAAEEVEKNGVDVGDNQATLLKKVEELTLYLIDENKKQKAQDQKLQGLEQQLNVLQKENEQLKSELKRINSSLKK